VNIVDKIFTFLYDKIDDLIWTIPGDSHVQANFDEFGRFSNFHNGTPNLTLEIPRFTSNFFLVSSSGRKRFIHYMHQHFFTLDHVSKMTFLFKFPENRPCLPNRP